MLFGRPTTSFQGLSGGVDNIYQGYVWPVRGRTGGVGKCFLWSPPPLAIQDAPRTNPQTAWASSSAESRSCPIMTTSTDLTWKWFKIRGREANMIYRKAFIFLSFTQCGESQAVVDHRLCSDRSLVAGNRVFPLLFCPSRLNRRIGRTLQLAGTLQFTPRNPKTFAMESGCVLVFARENREKYH